LKKILYVGTLEKIGGHETALCDFLESAFVQSCAKHGVYALNNKVHTHLMRRLKRSSTKVEISRSLCGINIPLSVSKIKFKYIKRNFQPSLMIFWNCIGSIKRKYKWIYEPGTPYIHYERGNIDSIPFEQNKLDYLNSAQLIIANSYATARHIALRFNPSVPVKVRLNALPGNFEKQNVNAKTFPSKRPFRVGVCGRLVAVKGFAIAIYAIKLLKERGQILELHIAGTGPEENNLYNLSSRLGIQDQVIFHGLINPEEMDLFYKTIDVLIVPSLREPFGKVSIDAQYMGCPVIASKIDGVPETIVEGETGYAISPSLTIEDYIKIGGSNKGIPELVYSPDYDDLMRPKAINPEHLAQKIMFLIQSPESYDKISNNAHTVAKQRFNREIYLKKVWSDIEKALQNCNQ